MLFYGRNVSLQARIFYMPYQFLSFLQPAEYKR